LTLDPWAAPLIRATTADEVLAAVRAYLDALPLELLAALPAACRPPPIRSAQDVSSYAFVLMNRCLNRQSDAALVGMNRYFTQASHRLAALKNPGGYTPRPLFNPR
jgi:hypothetical protein